MAALPQLVSPTIQAIEDAVARAETRRPDLVVRGSLIGKCERHLWYRFRWAHEPEVFEPRILRLFETGQIEEARMIGWLRGAGVTVEDIDPETGEQWEVAALFGHFKGHLDGIVTGVIEAPKTAHLLECKTHNAKSFAHLVRNGVATAKPEHIAQMQVYMHLKSLTRAFYLAKNKDTDALYAERVEYDPLLALELFAKAERVVRFNQPPARISEDPESWLCRFCPSKPICHGADWALRNCRSCLHSTPELDGDARWSCARYKRDLTLDDQQAGCDRHLFLPSLVPGDQVDADGEAEQITYQVTRGELAGQRWIDGKPREVSHA